MGCHLYKTQDLLVYFDILRSLALGMKTGDVHKLQELTGQAHEPTTSTATHFALHEHLHSSLAGLCNNILFARATLDKH
jgi:hypothetical protein